MAVPSSRRTHYTYEDYLSLEDLSLIRHEYFDGEIYAMAGGTLEHSALVGEISFILRQQLPGRCRMFTSDVRVLTPTGLTTYPDTSVVCHDIQRASKDRNALMNPVLLIEVTSNSTEHYDRGARLLHYQSIPALKEVLIVSHRERRISIHRRDAAGAWTSLDAVAGEAVTLESIGVTVRVDDVYREGLPDAPQS